MTDLYGRFGELTVAQRERLGHQLRRRMADRDQGLDGAGARAGGATRSPSDGPRLSVFFFSADADADAGGEADGDTPYRLLLEIAGFADVNGFAAVWVPERHFQRFGGLYPNPAVVAAAIAVRTERIGIRAGSVVLPLHDPIRVAEEWAVVDNLSGGRVAISFATGWHPVDFALAPDAYRDRRAVTYEGIEVVRKLWRGESLVRTDGSGVEVGVSIRPRPIQPELPAWLTISGNPESWTRAAELGAHVLCAPISLGVDGITSGIAEYRREWAARRHPGEGHVTLMLHAFVGDATSAVREQVRAPLSRYLEAFLSQYGSAEELRRRHPDLAVTDDDRAAIVEHAFSRYFDGWSLLGDQRKCAAVLDEVALAGVNEVACLVDFGATRTMTRDSLRRLAELDGARRASA